MAYSLCATRSHDEGLRNPTSKSHSNNPEDLDLLKIGAAKSASEPLSARSGPPAGAVCRPVIGVAADVAHAPGRAASARVPQGAVAGGQLPGPVLHAQACGRGYAPAGAPLRGGRGHRVLGHSRGAARTGPARDL